MWLAAVLPAIVLVCALPELLVRCADPMLEEYREIHFGNDSNSPALFQTDPRLRWKLRANTRLIFLNEVVRINRDGFRGPELTGSSFNVLCVGDSAPFGWRVSDEDSFPAQLENVLRTNRPVDHWQVLNAGVPGYSSLQVRLQAERLLPRWRPEVVVICVGNHDAAPAPQSDRAMDVSLQRGERFKTFLAHSRFLTWISERGRPDQSPSTNAVANAGPRVGLDEFAENLRETIRLARQHGARVVLVSPPVNLYLPPFVAQPLPDDESRQAWCLDVARQLEDGENAAATAEIERVLKSDPRDLYALWMKGCALTHTNRFAEGRALFEEALELHPYPGSCQRSYRHRLPRIASEENVDYLDSNEVLLKSVNDESPVDLYNDSCAANAEGNRLIAESLAKVILKRGKK